MLNTFEYLHQIFLSHMLKWQHLPKAISAVYSADSFRISVTTSACDSGISDVNIQMLGHWKSDTYKCKWMI